MIVLDASAVLALLHDEPGADVVAGALAAGVLGTVNLAEVVGELVDAGVDVSRLRPLLRSAGVTVETLSASDAELAGALRSIPGGRGCRWATAAVSRRPCGPTGPRCSPPTARGRSWTSPSGSG